MLTKRLLLPFVIMAITCAAAMAISAKGWEKIATSTVDDKTDHGTVFMTSEHNHPYNMIKLAVSKAPIRIRSILVTFGSGQTKEYTLSDLIADGGSTSDLSLPRPGYITRVDFWYEAASLEHKSRTSRFGASSNREATCRSSSPRDGIFLNIVIPGFTPGLFSMSPTAAGRRRPPQFTAYFSSI